MSCNESTSCLHCGLDFTILLHEAPRSAAINNIRWVAKSDACALSWRGAPLRRRSMQGRTPIMLKMATNNYRRETATAVSDIIAEGAVGAVPGTETCAACQRTFTSKRGLSVHQRRAHPVEFQHRGPAAEKA